MSEFETIKGDLQAAINKSNAEETLQILKTLSGKNMTLEALKATQIGVMVGKLRKSENSEICTLSKQLVDKWKDLVPTSSTPLKKSSEAIKSEKKPSPTTPLKNSESAIKSETSTPIKSEVPIKSETPIKTEGGASSSVKTEATPDKKRRLEDSTESLTKKKPTPSPASSSSSSSSSNDPRAKGRSLLQESLGTPQEGEGDPEEIGALIEDEVFKLAKGVNNEYRTKIRSLTFNLKTEKSDKLRRDVLGGVIVPAVLARLSPQELASPEAQAERARIAAYHLEAATLTAPQATTDMFQCSKCKSRACTYYQLQTRSADEPMTTFVSCTVCKNRWKFC